MIKLYKIGIFCLFFAFSFLVYAQQNTQEIQKDSVRVSQNLRRLFLKTPESIVESYKYSPETGKYIYSQKLGEYDISVPMFLSKEDYERLLFVKKTKEYFRKKSDAMSLSEEASKESKDTQRDLLPEFYVKSEFFESIFGGNNIDIIPQGSLAFDLGLRYNRNDNPAMTPENRSIYTMDFDQRISLGLTGQVGTRLKVNTMYDTQSTFDFQNIFKIEYTPNEDDIVRKVEVGNVSLPLNSSLITGAQSLFGVKTELQFGRTYVTGIFSEQRSQSKTLISQGGGMLQDFEFSALDYDENRNYFLSHFFRENYDRALENYPFMNSKVQITRIEVWATNRSQRTANIRNLIAIQDLGEAVPQNTRISATGSAPSGFFNGSAGNRPTNEANDFDPTRIGSTSILTNKIRDVATAKQGFGILANQMNEGFDYAVLENAQKLEEGRDYKVDTKLGYISLSQRLNNDEILAVAYQYTYEGKVYQVGEFANDGISATTATFSAGQNAITNNCLVLKMLKGTRVNTADPIWNLMMKNIYSFDALDINPEGFRLNIFYSDPSPVNYISAVDASTWNNDLTKKILLQLFNFDRLNAYNDPQNGGDGFFDFVPGITIDPQYGKIIFTKVEPFGQYLHNQLGGGNYQNPTLWNANQKKYVYKSLYSDIKAKAQEDAEKNKFILKGRYKSKGGKGISLRAFNVPKGAVRVRVGGRLLQEGIDYTVNYQSGTVQILDPSVENSNMPIEVSVENNTIFGGQNRRFMGVNVTHKFSDKLNVGASLINMRERPFTQKANYGQEPVNNTIFGLGGAYSTELPFLTRWLNHIPSMQSDVPSNLSVRGEWAYLHPSSPKSTNFDGEATAYLEDFESAQTTIDIRGARSWFLASTPLAFVPSGQLYGTTPDDPENLKNGYGRAKLAWYTIDPLFYQGDRPSDVSVDDISKNSTRRIFIDEIFPEREIAQGEMTVQNTLDLAYYPSLKGTYNNNPSPLSAVNANDKWGGIMRGISTTNFEDNNIEYIQFWMLDPYTDSEFTPSVGELVFDLGNISEDILKDGRKQYENGLPGGAIQTQVNRTSWGGVPASQSIMYSFDADTSNRSLQDIGLDGLNDAQEASIYTNNLADSPSDPALDNYEYYLSRSGGILNRYLNYNGTQGNSPVNISPNNQGSTTYPDVEDINRDNTMNTVNSYFEYRIPISSNIQRNDRFVTDIREVYADAPNGTKVRSRWIQYKIPIKSPNRSFGGGDLRSVTHIRMYLTGFNQDVVLRFGTFDLVRGDWRNYTKTLSHDLDDPSDDNTQVEISAVNVIENETRQPIPYKMPPGVYREQLNQNNTLVRQNEQSLSFAVCDLQSQDMRGVYKNINVDLRQYKRIKMFAHAQSYKNHPLADGQLVAFIRLGNDLSENFYEVQLPLVVTPSGAISEDAIWNALNYFDIPMDLLTEIKAVGINSGTLSQISYYDENKNLVAHNAPYTIGKQRYAIKGNPSLGSVRSMMIGVKNASGNHICGEVWFNELRLAELQNKGGWAAVGALDMNAADFMNLSLTGRVSTVGFGSVEQKPNERSREEIKQFDAMMSVNVGKLLPKSWNMQIPVGLNHSQSISTPEYDPQYEDLRLADRLKLAQTKAQKDAIQKQAEDYTIRQGVSFIGVKKGLSQGQKAKFYSLENFTLNYSYNQMYHHDFEIESQNEQNVRAGAMYSYSFEPLNLEPFKNHKKISTSKYLKWLSEINLNVLPTSIRIASNFNRTFSKQQFREVYEQGIDPSLQTGLPEMQQRNYMFDMDYGINYNLTRSLRVSFDANTSNIVRNYYTYDHLGQRILNKKLGLWNDFWNIGVADHYRSAFKLNYELPFDKLPFLQFIKSSYSYSGDFDWQRGSNAMIEVAGHQINTIQNASTHNFTNNITLDRFYRTLGVRARSASQKATFKNYLVDFATMVKRVGLNYTQTDATTLPGYLPNVGLFGTTDPTFGFVLGWQDDVRYEAAKRGWLTDFVDFNDQFIRSKSTNLTFTANLQPVSDLQIDLNADRQYTDNFTETFRSDFNEYVALIGNQTGNFSIADNMILTAFSKSTEYESAPFESLKENRLIIARRLALSRGIDISNPANLDQDGFPLGFGKTSQTVIMPAFYAAYTGRDAQSVSLKSFRSIPIPGWNVRYQGLMRLPQFKKLFRRFSLTHGYRASYTLNNFRTNLEYDAQNPNQTDQGGNFRSEKLFTNVNLVEQFSPLLRLDFEMMNSLSVLTEIIRNRTASISLDNHYLTEILSKEYRVGLGYRFKDLRFVTKFNGQEITLKSDLNLKADISFRNDFTVIRNMELGDNQVTSGQTSWLARFTADYALSRHLTAMYYFDYSFSKYAISTAFPMTTLRTGLTIRYTF